MAAPDFNTVDRIIRAAMRNAEILADGDDPTPEQYANFTARLQDMVNLWQTQGLKLWLNSIQTVALVAGTATYTLTGQPKRVLEAWYVDNSTPPISRPLIPMSWNTYKALSSQASQGAVNSYFIDKQLSATVMSLWLVPDATAAVGTVQVLVQNPVANGVVLTDTVGFPNEWYMALHWGLGAEIATGQPQEIIARCDQRAEMYRRMLEDWDVEDAPVTFQPNLMQNVRPSRFR